jgi:hypothetical protein
MSMNFAREQSLLRQKLQAVASPDLATARAQRHGGAVTFLGAADADVAAAAQALAVAWPQMGRAQMTAFVRTLWSSKIHELRAVGVQLLAARAALLEPADLPLLEVFLQEAADDAVHRQLAREVIGAIVIKNKKLWKDLKRFAQATQPSLRLAGVRGAAQALAADAEAFPRFTEIATLLLAVADADLQAAIDEALLAAAELHAEQALAFAQQHGRRVAFPKPKPKPAPPPAPTVSVAPAPQKAVKPSAVKPPAVKAAAVKPAAKKPAVPGKAAAKPTAKK